MHNRAEREEIDRDCVSQQLTERDGIVTIIVHGRPTRVVLLSPMHDCIAPHAVMYTFEYTPSRV